MKDFSVLIEKAIEARKNAYSPYSGYKVGASLLTKGESIYTGCNIENASYGATICAERVALGGAISAGEREFSAIAIVGGKDEISSLAYPCGICLQALSELCGGDLDVVLYDGDITRVFKLSELLPHGFSL